MNTNAKKSSAGQTILDYLAAKKRAKKAGSQSVTTEELAGVLGKPTKYAYDRAYWLAKRESKLVMIGSGKSAVWRLPKCSE